MSRGTVQEIWIAPEAGAPMESIPQARAIADTGLEGDRYRAGGSWSPGKDPSERELTLIECEQLEWFEQETGVALPAGQTRRNILTKGIQLNQFVGRRLRIGDVELEGRRLCEPCATLQKRTGLPILPAMVHRAGLNCHIVTSGEIRVGDAIVPMEPMTHG